ncbi:MAG: hypothetical protein P4L69_22060 [Desulfosporosinus sp.]|nr:hypothetical protein [Desulfosporosinus sp.]
MHDDSLAATKKLRIKPALTSQVFYKMIKKEGGNRQTKKRKFGGPVSMPEKAISYPSKLSRLEGFSLRIQFVFNYRRPS